jgi:hypothetical protein
MGGNPAEQAGEARPDGMQRLLSQAIWDTDGVRDEPLALMCLSSWAPRRLCWSLMKLVSPNEATSRLALLCTTVEAVVKWKPVRWACF